MTKFQRFLYNAFFLTLTSLGMRGIGVLFNRYLTVHLGTAGLGQFSLMMSVYGFAVTVASAGIHLAVTRVVSESYGCENRASVRSAVRCGLLFSCVFGGCASVILFSAAPMIADRWLGFPEAAAALRMLACSLPFLSLSTTVNGYFVAVRQAYKGAVIGVLCQGVRIICVVYLLRSWGAHSGIWPCYALVIGALVSEILCCLASFALFYPDYRRRCRVCSAQTEKQETGTARYVLHIALPILFTACIRSGLQTLLHLLIPLGLEKSGAASDAALSAYGSVHGIVLPVLLFPAALLTSFSGLLIPEVAEYRARGEEASVCRTASRVLRVTLCFSVFVSAVILRYCTQLGTLVGGDGVTGQYLRALAALIPIMYLDTMVDAFLKSLDAQLASMRYNLIDVTYCVVMAYLLLPHFGIAGYVFLLYSSELLNLALSIGKLISLIRLPIPLYRFIGGPILCAVGAVSVTGLFFRLTGISYRFALTALTVHILVCAIFYGCFLVLLGIVGNRERSVIRQLLFPISKLPLAKAPKAWYNKENNISKGMTDHDKRNPTEPRRTPHRL